MQPLAPCVNKARNLESSQYDRFELQERRIDGGSELCQPAAYLELTIGKPARHFRMWDTLAFQAPSPRAGR